MPISSTTRTAGPYLGNGSATQFAFAFKVFEDTDIAVVRADVLGVETTLTLDVHYTVSLNGDQDTAPGGTVTLGTPLATGEKLVIDSAIPALQPQDYTNQGGFYPEDLNDGLDRSVALIQQLDRRVDRNLRLPVSATDVDPVLPPPRANALLAFDSTGDGFGLVDPQDLITVAAYGQTQADVFTGDGVQTSFTLSGSPGTINNLRVSIDGVVQLPGEDYSWSGGTTLVFDEAPPNGLKILVQYAEALPEIPGDVDVSNKADRNAGNLSAIDVAAFNAKLEATRRPFTKPLMDFVGDFNAADWKPYFDAAVDWAAANAPQGVVFLLPRQTPAGGIPLSFVKPILSDNVVFEGRGRAIWTGNYNPAQDRCDIKLLASGSTPAFTWGSNAYDPLAPGGFTQRGGGLKNLNIRGWDATAAIALTRGVVNPQFKDLWVWVCEGGIRIENGYDPEIERVHIEGYKAFGIDVVGTGHVGGGAGAGRGDRLVATNITISGEGTESAPTADDPAFAIRGYWHTATVTNLQVVKGGGAERSVWVGDRKETSAEQRPHFITFHNLQIDYVRLRGLDIEDALDVWITGNFYTNGSPNEQLRIGASAENVSIQNPRGYGSNNRMVTIGGKNVNVTGGTFRAWNTGGGTTEPCVYVESTARNVKFSGTTFGDSTAGDTSENRVAIAVQSNTATPLVLMGCTFNRLAYNPVVVPVGLQFTAIGCMTHDGGVLGLANGASQIGGGLIQRLSRNQAIPRSVQARLDDRVSVKDFGAFGDGASHTLAATTTYRRTNTTGWTLGQWQTFFPNATSLSQEIDLLAFQLAATNASGTIIYAPAGTYIMGVGTVTLSGNGTAVVGEGMDATIFKTSNVNTPVFDIYNNSGGGVSYCRGWPLVDQAVGGCFIRMRDSFMIRSIGVGVRQDDGGQRFYAAYEMRGGNQFLYYVDDFRLDFPKIGFWVGSDATFPQDVWIGRGIVAASTIAGYLIQNVGGLYIWGSPSALNCLRGMDITPGAGQTVSGAIITGMLADTCDGHGFRLRPSGNGRIVDCQFIGCWSSSNGTNPARGPVSPAYPGFQLFADTGTIDGIQFVGGIAINNLSAGLTINKARNVTVTGFHATYNSILAPNAYAGIYVGPDAVNVSLVGCFSGAEGKFAQEGLPPTQKYGIDIDAAATNVMVSGCMLEGNVSGKIFNGPGTKAWINQPPRVLNTSSTIISEGDISIGGFGPQTLAFNCYYSLVFNQWIYNGNGPAGFIRLGLDGGVPKFGLWTAPENTMGPEVVATMTFQKWL